MAITSPTRAPPPPDTMTVKVDGKLVVVPKTMPDPVTGKPAPTTMIQACNLAGVDVPHYCYHPKLPVAGSCRMCLVEYGTPALGPDRQPVRQPDGSLLINKSPRPAIACATPLSPGMEVYTNTPAVKQMRQGVLEFLLINHPLDCPICDQAGECALQQYAVEYGEAASRFVEAKVHKPKQVELGPRVMLDDERCILCSRCIRFTRDIVGDDALGIVNRGGHSTLAAYPGRAFANNYTLNTVDLCPVGALTSKDFRFRMRVWFLKETKSLCSSCGTGCNILIGSRQNRVYRCVPRQNDAVNACWLCDAGRLNYQWIGRPDRLSAPRVRRAGGSAKGGRRQVVLKDVAGRLRNAPQGSVAIIASARQTNEELYLLSQLAKRLEALTDSVPRLGEGDRLLVSSDRNPNSNGARLTGLAGEPMGARLPRISAGIRRGTIKTLVVFGEDVTKHGFVADLLDQLDALIVSDILPNPTTERADYLLPGCAHAEKSGTFTNIKGRVQRFMPAVAPPGEARPEIEFLEGLLFGVSGVAPAGNVAALFDRMAQDVPAFHGLSWAALGDAGLTVPLPRSQLNHQAP